jgi:hypothetical protein
MGSRDFWIMMRKGKRLKEGGVEVVLQKEWE